MMTPSVWVIVLNWNGSEDTLHCLSAFGQEEKAPFRLLVVDNGSTDDSIERLRSANIPLLALSENLGFAGGMNRGAEHAISAGAEMILFLNNDTEVLPGAISQLVEGMENGIGITVPTILRMDGSLEYAGGSFLPWSGTVRAERRLSSTEREVSFASGCCFLIRADLFERLGGFRERNFLYFEDVDLGLRVIQAGFRIRYLPEARIRHVGGKSTGSQGRKSPVLDYYDVRNGLFLIREHLAGWQRCTALLYFWFIRLPRKLCRIFFFDRRFAHFRAISDALRDARVGKGGAYRSPR